MANRNLTEKKKLFTPQQQQSTTLPPSRPFTDPLAATETTVAPKRMTSAPFSFSNVNVMGRSSSRPIQPKLSIGEPGDKYEQEADNVARQVVQQINSPSLAQREEDVQRMPLGQSIRRMPIQRKSSIPVGPASGEFEQSLSRARGGGSSLAPKVQTQMESAMGADFSRVKIHTDGHADQLSRSIQAKAFTTGNDVFFKQGEYNPGSRNGQELLAHELTHVVQQSGTGSTTQINRAIDETKVDTYKQLLGLTDVTIIEVDSNALYKTKFKDYASTYELGPHKDKCMLNLFYDDQTIASMLTNPNCSDEVNAKSQDIIEMQGGGCYVSKFNMAFYNAGISNVDRTMLHEMGHGRQNQDGANFDTTERIILEYHNVLAHENQFVDLPEGSGESLKICYKADDAKKASGKSWDEMRAHACHANNPRKDKNTVILAAIQTLIDGKQDYKDVEDTIKQNLTNEYFKWNTETF